jgi:hypothetical protein
MMIAVTVAAWLAAQCWLGWSIWQWKRQVDEDCRKWKETVRRLESDGYLKR